MIDNFFDSGIGGLHNKKYKKINLPKLNNKDHQHFPISPRNKSGNFNSTKKQKLHSIGN